MGEKLLQKQEPWYKYFCKSRFGISKHKKEKPACAIENGYTHNVAI